MRLENKVAIITGGASGIGLAAVELFLKEGADVVIADFDKVAGSKQAERLQREGKIHFVCTDVSKIDDVELLVNKTLDLYGKIDILINNAGITDDATLLKMNEEQFNRVLNINVNGVFNCTKAVAPLMIEQGKGKIINTSSVSGVYGNFGQSNYAATKAAVVGLTKTWAKEFGSKGINVNAVAPGFTMTEMVAKMPENVIEKMKGNISLNRLAVPGDIANAYLFLASEESDYIHGHVLHVDGGIMM